MQYESWFYSLPNKRFKLARYTRWGWRTASPLIKRSVLHVNNTVKKIALFGVVFLAGCQSESARKLEPSTKHLDESGISTLIVIAKENAKLGESGFSLHDNEKTLLSYMKISKTIEFEVPSGGHLFTVSSSGSPAFKLQAHLQPNTKTCIQIKTNNANYYGKFIFPIMRNAVPTHVAELIPCELQSST